MSGASDFFKDLLRGGLPAVLDSPNRAQQPQPPLVLGAFPERAVPLDQAQLNTVPQGRFSEDTQVLLIGGAAIVAVLALAAVLR